MTQRLGTWTPMPENGPSLDAILQRKLDGEARLDDTFFNHANQVAPVGVRNGAYTGKEPVPKIPAVPTHGVGSELSEFKIGVVYRQGKAFSFDKRYPVADIELAPARMSYFDRQGQRVPGAGAGLENNVRASVVKLNVAANRPIYQHFGISEETLEWVGAFVGFDNGNYREGTKGEKREVNAFAEAMQVKDLFRVGREIMVKLSWANGFSVRSNASAYFRGLIKTIDFAYATEQRVYYRICVMVTNREDIGLSVTGRGTGYNELSNKEILPPASPTGGDTFKRTKIETEDSVKKIEQPENQNKNDHDQVLQNLKTLYDLDPTVPVSTSEKTALVEKMRSVNEAYAQFDKYRSDPNFTAMKARAENNVQKLQTTQDKPSKDAPYLEYDRRNGL